MTDKKTREKDNNSIQEKWVKFITPHREKVNPFSLAKYFYEKGVEDLVIIQKLIYLTFIEVLEKENILLDFNEDFQAWSGCPVLEKVFFTMLKDRDEYKSYEKTFEWVPSLDKEKIIKHCENWLEYFQIIQKNKQRYKLSEMSRNKPWTIARSKVSNHLDHERIKTDDIIDFVQQRNGLAKI